MRRPKAKREAPSRVTASVAYPPCLETIYNGVCVRSGPTWVASVDSPEITTKFSLNTCTRHDANICDMSFDAVLVGEDGQVFRDRRRNGLFSTSHEGFRLDRM